MNQTLSYIIAFSGFVCLTDCTSEDRFQADTRSCNWETWVPGYYPVFQGVELLLARSRTLMSDVNGLYQLVNQWTEMYRTMDDDKPEVRLRKSALTLLDESNGLQTRDCFDICTYVLAKNCCKSGRHQHACYPKSRAKTFIKSMISARVFPMIERCQTSVMYSAIVLNTTLVGPDLYAQVSVITEFMTAYKSEKFNSIENIVLASPKPYSAILDLIKPSSTGFFESILNVMIRLERLVGESSIENGLSSRNFGLSTGFMFYRRLILTPCNRFIEIMRTAMDPTLYYGGIIDADRSKFRLEHMNYHDRIGYFNLLHRYQACVWLNNHESYEIDWAKVILHRVVDD